VTARLRAPRRALVLSGGGARGAYEAGVLRYLFDELPRELGRPPRIDIVTGTSVGAIHACFVAATADRDAGRCDLLSSVWSDLRARELFGSAPHEFVRLPRRMLAMLQARRSLRSRRPPERLHGLLATERLEQLVARVIPWPRIAANLREGHVDALSVATTEVATGRVVVFVQTRPDDTPRWTFDLGMVARPTTIGPAHALASAAIPGIFPAVRLESTYHVDGGLRLNTPLAPALRLGADRVLVVALRKGPLGGSEGDLAAQRVEHYGNPLFLLGKVLNALILDHVEADLSHLRLLNDVLRRFHDAAGPAAVSELNRAVEKDRGQPFKIIEDLVVRPSQDLGVLAGQIANRAGGTSLKLLLRAFGFGGDAIENDFLSYFFFDAAYTAPLMQLGLEDARSMRDAIVEFFRD
jgi:NTE family protein